MPEDRGRGDIRNDVYLFLISNEYENRLQIDKHKRLRKYTIIKDKQVTKGLGGDSRLFGRSVNGYVNGYISSALKKGIDHEMFHTGFCQFVNENVELQLIDLDLLTALYHNCSRDDTPIHINGKL